MKKILVTGANGQLGRCIQSIKDEFPNFKFTFVDRSQLDITNEKEVVGLFKSHDFDWCLNCAAYTAVDKAEEDIEKATDINVNALNYLVKGAEINSTRFIHVSTDFVFNGKKSVAYTEIDDTNPLGIYGSTKREGELLLNKTYKRYFIIRTSWLYSEYNQNFLKTMLRLAGQRDEINVVSDQIGTPTYARDLAYSLLTIIKQDSEAYGIYNFSNEGVASWYDFAKAIFEINNTKINVNPIHTEDYPTPAKRPHFSVLDKSKIKKTFNISIPYWRDSLKIAITNL
ncbi:dTDP-4-dehydrorhamnose reductase [Psychroserpens sp. XS_ASV72]|uniref:dTDP-4-dehydrorhamnose reductase n=1 Tax=Psychroserpens sp. XS_ASV72 TaxID=3241293 RepID=UPI0035195703